MQGYTEILTALGAIIPGFLSIAIPVGAKRRPGAEVIVLTPELRAEALRKRALRSAGSSDRPAA